MRENFLHYIWKYKKFNTVNIKTTQHDPILIISTGMNNQNSGPDFFNAKIRVGNQLWAGNVEIHVNSSDWFAHNHEQDKTYDNVILHVVYNHDIEIYRKDNSSIPTLQLREYIDREVLNNYQNLLSNSNNKWINCETDFASVEDFIFRHWLERLYFERLEQKSNLVSELLNDSKNDWEAVLFKMLARSFGLKVNSEAFFSMANSITFSMIRKTRSNLDSLEALFFGQSGLLENPFETSYYQDLKREYKYLAQKYQLTNKHTLPLQFFRLRPVNFPTLRLSQLANLYHKEPHLFSKIMQCKSLEDFYECFSVSASIYWDSHYTFESASKASKKRVTRSFIDLLLINTILPIKFSYARYNGQFIDEIIINIVSQIASEKNSIIKQFDLLKKRSNSALESQALIQLKTEYCDKNKCLQCAIGNALIIK
ncbi:DUF2851 family protein [uncultured Psychroserpens sp.]|uniref:DUF2851 family protein n=1 Tax=uncultured Psychroserpens sp. TaxID=255436 RepID=UPI00261106CA|nr:DUF2851 family protein [uncultured Psychroserpens sp.]